MQRAALLSLLLTLSAPAVEVGARVVVDPRGQQAESEVRVAVAAPATRAPEVRAAIAALGSELERAVRAPGWRGDAWSVLVVSLDYGDTLYARSPETMLAPASNMKLFTTAAALYYLGPEYRYHTFLLTDGTVRDGILEGDLIVYGTGDPTLSTHTMEVWESFADSLASLGIREVSGAVVGDASFFDGPGSGEGWRESYVNAAYAAPASALTFNENLVTLRIQPARQAGARPEIEFVPGGDGIAIENRAVTVAGGRTQIYAGRAAYDGPIVVTGEIALGNAVVSRVVPVGDPAVYTAAVLRQVLDRRGIRVAGGVREVTEAEHSRLTRRTTFAPVFEDGPALRLLAVHASPPLLEILEVINKRSHNLYAEHVLRTVGRAVFGEGTAEAGARATRYFLECETGVRPLMLEMLDGSGLSPLNRVSASTLVQLLAYMAESPLWEAYWHTLPEAGSPDGLRRMQQTPADGNLRAKTGTIDRVSALSGYVRAREGERLAFAIVSNNVPSTWRAKRAEDEIGARLAAFRRPNAPAGEPDGIAPTHPAFSLRGPEGEGLGMR